MSGYDSHMVGDRMYRSDESREFMRAILVNEGWIDDHYITHWVNEIAKLRGDKFSNDEARLAAEMMTIVDKNCGTLHDVSLETLVADLLGYFEEMW